MVVYLIRHGETELNKEKRLQGQKDIPLNANGKHLAQITAKALENVSFHQVFSSPLTRALNTAEIIVGNKKIPIITDDRIQEISFGEYEGLCYRAQGYSIPDPDFMRFFDAPQLYTTPPKGESFADIIERTGDFWKSLVNDPKNEDKTILVSTHGCALKAILANIRQTQIKDFWGAGVHKNCAVTIINVLNREAQIVEEGKIFYE